MEDVIIFDPGDLAHPLGLNMLEYDLNKPEQKTFIVNEMQSIIVKLFPESGDALGTDVSAIHEKCLIASDGGCKV